MNGPEPDISFAPPAIEVQAVIDRHTRPTEDVDFIQAGELYRRVMDDEAKTNLISNITGHLGDANENIQYRQVALFYKCDVEYGCLLYTSQTFLKCSSRFQYTLQEKIVL